MDTIAAISTPAGSGGIAVIRISGKNAKAVVDKFFVADSGQLKPRHAHLGSAQLEGFSDRCIVTYFASPNSYTGEDVVEISCHGGIFIAESVLRQCLKMGAVPATNGEFTRRAFLNGKLTLADAEGVIDLINSESAAEANAAAFLADGELSRETQKSQAVLLDLIASVEAALDYPDDVDMLNKGHISATVKAETARLKKLTASYGYGKMLKRGLNVAIIGRPNAGKSSLLNALLKFDRSIVAPVAGTTRDTVSEVLLIKDIKVNLIDTAGIRTHVDEVERQGIQRSRRALDTADLILYIFDSMIGFRAEDAQILAEAGDKKVILLANKCDMTETGSEARAAKDENGAAKNENGAAKDKPTAIKISALTGTNIDKVAEEIYSFASGNRGSGITITNERHLLTLERAISLLTATDKGLKTNTADLIAADLTAAYKALGEITGTTANEDIINKIFEKFCLGK